MLLHLLNSSRASFVYGINHGFSVFQKACKRFLPNILQLKLDVSSMVFGVFFFVFSPKILEHMQVALPITMYKHLSRAASKSN